MRYRTDSGLLLEGTESQIKSALRGLGYNPDLALAGMYYDSESRGLILIQEMETTHLRNAVLKMYKEWVNTLYRISDPKKVVEAIINGNPDPNFRALIIELAKREEYE